MTVKEDLHRLIDELPEHDARRLLRELGGRAAEALRGYPRSLREAPLDDEPETEEERLGVAEALEDLAAGRVVSHEDVRREFGW